ncbi:DNA repair exonuclease [Archaeoglobus fulgidus DSM 8774]|uniref:DNA double-strand break repair protein Mre11 n=1 Tax=Archaeoglobus fulgidus DSM 8774 TaxID=1344584 RepID=A0A075WE51_ARCFL|nr:exonuclease SbcCD subunit D [Archaeoglobus fulgidus]AIG97419.1 DNA repair exonuclease [Archaeoglobus fulgidus DSM 8774]
MRIAHMSDTHLGYRQYNLDERENDFYEAFNEAIDKAIEERADVLIHSGDLFDSPTPPIKAIYAFKNALKKVEGKMKVFTVLGDHDTPKRRGMPPHKLFDVPVLGIGGLEWVEIDGVLIAGISNLRGTLIDHLRKQLSKFDSIAEKYRHSVLIAHQAIETHLPFEGAYELKEDDLPRKATYYAFGHLHSRVLERFGNGWLAYSGSTEIVRRDEISAWKKKGKGLYLVDRDSDVTVHAIDLDIRPQIEVTVGVDELEKLVEYTQYPKQPVLHITVEGGSINRQHVVEKLRDILRGRVLSYRHSFRELGEIEVEIPKGPVNIKAIFDEYLGDEKLSELAFELYELLADGNVSDAISVAERFMEVDGR